MSRSFQPTKRTRVRRLPERGRFDKKTVHAILDAAPICHVGFVVDGQPFVLPHIHGRRGDTLYLHGSAGGRGLRAFRSGAPLCVTATIVDGLVLARALFHHSMNYRSVVALGAAREVRDPREVLKGLEAIAEHAAPGRWKEARKPNPKELAQTSVVALELSECSAKVRAGPPHDDEEDIGLPIWAGVLPLKLVPGDPIPDPDLKKGTKLPPSVRRYVRALH